MQRGVSARSAVCISTLAGRLNGGLALSLRTLQSNNAAAWPVAVCNRTYYGDVGKTYELELQKPQENRLPFLCHLTFTANGHIHGDLVQVRALSLHFPLAFFICASGPLAKVAPADNLALNFVNKMGEFIVPQGGLANASKHK